MDNNTRLGQLSMNLWDRFDEVMRGKGYKVSSHNNATMGMVSLAFTENKFKPIFNFRNWFRSEESLHSGFVSIFVIDRNGNSILTGDAAAIYSLDIKKGDKDEDVKQRFEKMLENAINKYGSYCRENRLDFVYNEMVTERVNY